MKILLNIALLLGVIGVAYSFYVTFIRKKQNLVDKETIRNFVKQKKNSQVIGSR